MEASNPETSAALPSPMRRTTSHVPTDCRTAAKTATPASRTDAFDRDLVPPVHAQRPDDDATEKELKGEPALTAHGSVGRVSALHERIGRDQAHEHDPEELEGEGVPRPKKKDTVG